MRSRSTFSTAGANHYSRKYTPFAPSADKYKSPKKFLACSKEVKLIAQHKKHVQDPYSFRCMPQVHGASADAIGYVGDIFLTEVNSVTDNPNIFPEEDLIISAETSTANRSPWAWISWPSR